MLLDANLQDNYNIQFMIFSVKKKLIVVIKRRDVVGSIMEQKKAILSDILNDVSLLCILDNFNIDQNLYIIF